MNKQKEALLMIEQVMHNLSDLIDPKQTDSKEFEHILNDKFRSQFIKDHAECFIQLNLLHVGTVQFFPICNRSGAQDPKMVELSRKVAERLLGDSRVDQASLQVALAKIQLMRAKGEGLGPI
jgi:hypothetical protein